MKITDEQAREAVISAFKSRGPEYFYDWGVEAPEYGCRYRDAEGKGSCLIGRVLEILSPRTLAQVSEGLGITEAISRTDMEFSPEMLDRMQEAQSLQGDRVPYRDIAKQTGFEVDWE